MTERERRVAAWMVFGFLWLIHVGKSPAAGRGESGQTGSVQSRVDMNQVPKGVVRISGVLSREGSVPFSFEFPIRGRVAVMDLPRVPEGRWLLTVHAVDDQHVVQYTGTAEVEVQAGDLATVPLTMRPTVGDLKITLSWGGDSEQALLAYFPLDGHARDESGQGHHGSMVGALPAVDRHGKASGALSFGRGAYVRLDNAPEFNHLKAFTMACWVCPTSLDEYHFIFSKVSPNRDYTLSICRKRLDAHMADSSYKYYRCLGTSDMPLNVWTHVAGVWTGSEWKVYLNGALNARKEYPGIVPPWTGREMSIGAMGFGSCPFFGSIDEVRLYGRALSDREIRALCR